MATPLHGAAANGQLETAKLLMVYGADLNAKDNEDKLPIDLAIRDEPRRRMDHGHKRATEQDRHPNAAAAASAQQEEDDEEEEKEPSSKLPRLDGGAEAEDDKVAEEDENSEPSSDEEEDN